MLDSAKHCRDNPNAIATKAKYFVKAFIFTSLKFKIERKMYYKRKIFLRKYEEKI